MARPRSKQTVTSDIQGSPFLGDIKTAQVSIDVDYHNLYVTSANWQPYPAIRTLDSHYDEFTCKLGLDTLRKMALDSELSASIGIYISAIFNRDMEFISPIEDADSPFYDIAKQIAGFLQSAKSNSDFSWEEQLKVATKLFLTYGTSMVEHQISYDKVVAGVNGWKPDFISPLSVEDYRLVVDNYNKVVGAVPYAYGFSLYQQSSGYLPIDQLQSLTGIVPKTKFSLFGFNRTSQDPRGSSILTPAYPSWWLKQQLLLEFSAYIKRFAPIIYGTVSATAIPLMKKVNGVDVVVNPVDELSRALKQMKNGAVSAFAHGTEIGVLDLSKSGDFFINAIKLLDLQSARAVTRQHLASGEGEHQARSASEVHQDILVLGIKEIKQFLTTAFRLGFSRTWTTLNFGEQYAFLAPIPSFGRGSGLPLSVDDVLKLHQTGYLTAEQYPQTDGILDLTPRAVEVVEQGKKLLEDSEVDEGTKENIDNAVKALTAKVTSLPRAMP